LVISACSSDPTTTADLPAPTTAAAVVTTRFTSSSAPVSAATPSTTTPPVPSTVADVAMEAFASDVAELCAASPLLASLPDSDGTVETAKAQIALLRDAEKAMKVEDLVVPPALQPQQDAIIELDAAADVALADAEAAVAAGDGALAAKNVEVHLEIRKGIGVRYAIMGATCGPIEAERAASAALNVPLEGNPEQISLGFGSVWLSELDGGKVARIDPDTGEVLARIDVGARPLKLQPADGRMWVRTGDAFVRIDPNTNTVDATLRKADVGPAANRNYAVDGTMWVCDGRQLHRYDPTSLHLVATIDLDIDCDFVQAWDDLVIAWVYNDDPSLSADPAAAMIDPATNQVLATVPLPTDVMMPVVYDDRVFFAGNLTSKAVVVDRADWSISSTPDLGRVTHGGGIATDGDSIYIPTEDGFPKDVLVVDAVTYEVVDTIEPLDLNALALDDDGSLWVASGRLGVVQRFDLPA
jgi:hypothetical protein